MNILNIYTDGSCQGNGKSENTGGFGVVVLDNNENLIYNYSKQTTNTTNNREELKAMLYALMITQYDVYKKEKCIIYCDSAYVVNICNDWIWIWQRKGWVRSGGQPIENLDLIKQIYQYLSEPFPNFTIEKVKGHSGTIGNELADAVATNNKAKIAKIMEENKEMFPE